MTQKVFFSLLVLVLMVQPIFGQPLLFITKNSAMNGGIGIGAVIAIVASWSRNQSILWAIFHAFCGWIYVIYFAVTSINKN